MENTRTVCADDLPTILRKRKVSVNNCLQQLDFEPSSIRYFVCQPRLRPDNDSAARSVCSWLSIEAPCHSGRVCLDLLGLIR